MSDYRDKLMRLYRVIGLFCLILGVVFLGFGLIGVFGLFMTSGETRRVGSGEFAMDMPKTTVFQEIGVGIYALLGATLIGAAACCESAVHYSNARAHIASPFAASNFFGVWLIWRSLQLSCATPVREGFASYFVAG
jgi:hypothetical protein